LGVDPIRRPVIAAEMERRMNKVELEGAHLSKPMRNAGEILFALRLGPRHRDSDEGMPRVRPREHEAHPPQRLRRQMPRKGR
jgi:hypothetical protein